MTNVGMSSGANGPAVVRLHRVLEVAGLVIDEREKERQEFGASTLEALLAFHRRIFSRVVRRRLRDRAPARRTKHVATSGPDPWLIGTARLA